MLHVSYRLKWYFLVVIQLNRYFMKMLFQAMSNPGVCYIRGPGFHAWHQIRLLAKANPGRQQQWPGRGWN